VSYFARISALPRLRASQEETIDELQSEKDSEKVSEETNQSEFIVDQKVEVGNKQDLIELPEATNSSSKPDIKNKPNLRK